MKTLILGTRASALALAQTELTRSALVWAFPQLEVRVETFVTQGDKKLDLNLLQRSPGGGKGLFTRELEEALLSRRIDVAVHSLKDLPGHMPEGLEIASVLERSATSDLLVSKFPGGLDGLPHGALVGTSSIRRARQLQWLRGDLQVAEWRGNVQTRLRKLGESQEFAAIVLAEAGLLRLGFIRVEIRSHLTTGVLRRRRWGTGCIRRLGRGSLRCKVRWGGRMYAARSKRLTMPVLGWRCGRSVNCSDCFRGIALCQ